MDARSKKDKIKLSLEVSPELNATLENLVVQGSGSSKSEVLRKAIALMQVAVDARQQGKRVGIAEQDQPLATEFVGF